MAYALRHSDINTGNTRERHDELKAILEGRRQVLLADLNGRLRGVRSEIGSRPLEGQDFGEVAVTEMQDDIQFALLEMRAETLNKIDEALVRLDNGLYGYCLECGDEVSEARLRALPFALRCVECESARESAARTNQLQMRRAGPIFELPA